MQSNDYAQTDWSNAWADLERKLKHQRTSIAELTTGSLSAKQGRLL